MSKYSLVEYCASQIPMDVMSLPASTQSFLERLGLPTRHPFCEEYFLEGGGCVANDTAVVQSGPLLLASQLQQLHDTRYDAAVTWIWQTVPPVWAFTELWVRLLAGWIAPVLVTYLLFQSHWVHYTYESVALVKKQRTLWCPLLSLACSSIVMTDSNYVLEFGSRYGVIMFSLSLGFSLQVCRSSIITRLIIISVVLTTATLTWDYEHHTGFHLGTQTDVDIHIREGLYYNANNTLVRTAVEQFWSPQYYTYGPQATRWMLTGDARTGLPFFFNKVLAVDWKRVFLKVSEDGEVLALDMAFPDNGYNSSNPIYLILHGLNGGSNEDYCRDLALRRTKAGSTVIVMVSRGLMDLPLADRNIFRADRLTDAHEAALAIRRAMEPGQILAGVGYSMGAIVLNNYVATYGTDCALSAAISISGALECRYEMDFRRPQRLWQPMIVDYSRQRHVTKWYQHIRDRLGRNSTIAMMRSTNVVDFDQHIAVEYYRPRYKSLTHYYGSMGALGDVSIDSLESENISSITNARISNVSIPLCVMHAFDDPIATWKGVAANSGFMHPQNMVHSGNGNILLLLTDRGGHVGWPVGWLSFRNDWQFMSEAASSFVEAIAHAHEKIHSDKMQDCAKSFVSESISETPNACSVHLNQTNNTGHESPEINQGTSRYLFDPVSQPAT